MPPKSGIDTWVMWCQLICSLSASWKIQATHNTYQSRDIHPSTTPFMLSAQLHNTSPSLQRIFTDLRPFNDGACHSRSDTKTAFPSNYGQSSLKRQCRPAQYRPVGDKSVSIQNTWRRFRNHILIFKDTNPPGIYAYWCILHWWLWQCLPLVNQTPHLTWRCKSMVGRTVHTWRLTMCGVWWCFTIFWVCTESLLTQS